MPQDKRYICKQITHTHAHPYTHTYSTLSRRQSEARNFLCDHIASGPCVCVCVLTPTLPRPPAAPLPDKFHPDELTLSHCRRRRVQAEAKVTLLAPQG